VASLATGLARNVYESDEPGRGGDLAAYALEARALLASQSIETVLSQARWPEVAR
jgi:hypothetical protein